MTGRYPHRSVLAVALALLLAACGGSGGGSGAASAERSTRGDASAGAEARPGASDGGEAAESPLGHWSATYSGFAEGDVSGSSVLGVTLGKDFKLALGGAGGKAHLQLHLEDYEDGSTGRFGAASALFLLPSGKTCSFEALPSFEKDGGAAEVQFEDGTPANKQGTLEATLLCGARHAPLRLEATFAE